jgi:hypothetical protein
MLSLAPGLEPRLEALDWIYWWITINWIYWSKYRIYNEPISNLFEKKISYSFFITIIILSFIIFILILTLIYRKFSTKQKKLNKLEIDIQIERTSTYSIEDAYENIDYNEFELHEYHDNHMKTSSIYSDSWMQSTDQSKILCKFN